MKPDVYISVKNKKLMPDKPILITSGSSGILIEFIFDDEWAIFSRSVAFFIGGRQKIVPLIFDRCFIPYEYCKYGGDILRIGVIGTYSGALISSTILKILIYDAPDTDHKALDLPGATDEDIIDTFPALSLSGSMVSFVDEVGGLPLKTLLVDIPVIQTGSGDPAPDNVRPISGHDGVTVWAIGENVADNVVYVQGKYYTDNGGTASSVNTKRVEDYLPVSPSTKYTYYFVGGLETVHICVHEYDSEKNWIRQSVTTLNRTGTWTTGNTTAYIRYSLPATADNIRIGVENISIESAFPNPPGMVYGGTLNVLTGMLTIDRAYLELDGSNDETWNTGSTGYFQAKTLGSKSGGFAACNRFPKKSSGSNRFNVVTNYTRFYSIDNISTLSDFKTWISTNPLELVYELAAPQTIQLTPGTFYTLFGENCIWADAGNINIEYRVDPRTHPDTTP